MDKRLNKDWTGSVRDRLEKRELKPSDELWEHIGEALPQAVAPHRVRRLPWGGFAGAAAAAAAVAAVLLLRPSGAPEPGRVDVVPAASAPVAMLEDTHDTMDARSEPGMTEEGGSFAPLGMTGKAVRHTAGALGQTVEALDKTVEALVMTGEALGMTVEALGITGTGPEETDALPGQDMTKEAEDKTAKQAATGTINTVKTSNIAAKDEVCGMSIEEYIEMEENAKRRHRSLTAAVYAVGVPSTSGLSKGVMYDMDNLSEVTQSDAPLDGGSMIPAEYGNGTASTDTINGANSGKNGGNVGGYTNNPESQNGFEPVRYIEDPYNINGSRMNHSRPIGAGLALTMPLGDHFFAESGVYWSWLRSTSAMVSSQSLHSIGIPLKLGYSFGGPGRISFALSAGGKAEKVVYAVRAGTRFKEPGVQFAAVGNAAVQFDITRNLGLFIAPELSYWFTETALPTYNTENPLNLSLKAGLNLTLGR